mgnify:CR=1 FL=1
MKKLTSENKKLTSENKILKSENKLLKKEIIKNKKEFDFINKIFKYSDSLIHQMKRKSINGKPVWINIHHCSKLDLEKLDPDEETKLWIKNKNIIYDDSSWYR